MVGYLRKTRGRCSQHFGVSMGPETKAFCLSGLSSLEKPFLFEINTKLVFFNFPNPTHPDDMFYKRTSDYTFLQERII